ncbi:MAG: hypothetical protein ACOX47_06060 [Bacillota bacterium]
MEAAVTMTGKVLLVSKDAGLETGSSIKTSFLVLPVMVPPGPFTLSSWTVAVMEYDMLLLDMFSGL